MTADIVVGTIDTSGMMGPPGEIDINLSDLTPETQALLRAASAMTEDRFGHTAIILAARAFAASVKVVL